MLTVIRSVLQKPIKRGDGRYVPWSILGDSANYEHFESNAEQGIVAGGSTASSVKVVESISMQYALYLIYFCDS